MIQAKSSETPAGRSKHGLLLSLLGLLIVVEAITVFVVLASQQYATENALREHTQELLQNAVDETRENAVAYLGQAQDSVSLAAGLFEARLLSGDEAERLEAYFLQQLKVLPQIDALYFGDARGNFVFSKRDNSDDSKGFFSKIIRNGQPDESRVTRIQRSSTLDLQSRKADASDTYDPRERPWFKLARASQSVVWTDPYIFYTSQHPGLTVARAVRDGHGALVGVIGADIELSALSGFLRKQRIGASGQAFIVYSNGDVLAHPDTTQLAAHDGDSSARLKRLREMDPITARAGERLRAQIPDLVTLNRDLYDSFEVDSRRYLSMFVPFLNRGGNQWVMGVYAPADEMAQTIRKGQRESIYLGIAMSLLSITAALIIGLFVFRPIYTLQQQAREDPLTGLLNRRSFDELAGHKLSQAKRTGQPMAAIMIDIDCFKPINDEYGHSVGDEVLLVAARRIDRGLSDEDILGRYGGEEFAAILPDASLDRGMHVAERLREQVGETPIKTSIGPLDVTISLGVAMLSEPGQSLAGLLDIADQNLLQAKRDGRNRVVSAAS